MPKQADWYYHRKNCTTCARSQDFLTARGVRVKEQTDARKDRLDRQQALQLAKAADKVIVAKGKSTLTFDMAKNPPDDAALLASIIGPTGNLRAPAVRRGKLLLIGFNVEAYAKAFG